MKKFEGKWWQEEIRENGWQRALLDRLYFHGTLDFRHVADSTGRSRQTVRRHMADLVTDGQAEWWFANGELMGITRKKNAEKEAES